MQARFSDALGRKVVDEIYDEFVAKKMGIDQKGQVCATWTASYNLPLHSTSYLISYLLRIQDNYSYG